MPRTGSCAPTSWRRRAALREDLDTPRAIAVLDAWADEDAGTAVSPAPVEQDGAPDRVDLAVDALFGIELAEV